VLHGEDENVVVGDGALVQRHVALLACRGIEGSHGAAAAQHPDDAAPSEPKSRLGGSLFEGGAE
jgi:hypothetical protein